MRLHYAIKFVDDMDSAVAFHRDKLGLTLGFASPYWSEFETGETRLALHPASADNPAGTVQLGFEVGDVDLFFERARRDGLTFTSKPEDVHGRRIARFLDCDGAESSVSSPG